MTTVITDLQYAGDCAFLAHIAEEFQTSLSMYMTFHQHKKTKTIYQHVPSNNEEPHDIKTYGTTLEIVEHFPYLGSHLSQKASIVAEIHHRNISFRVCVTVTIPTTSWKRQNR